MRFAYLVVLLIVELLFWIQTAYGASPVMNEVMWPGSDLSSSDEWIELTLPFCSVSEIGCTDIPRNLASWTITNLRNTGQEDTMITFPAGFVVQPGQYLVIAHFSAEHSRLLAEPALINAAITLVNTGLRLKLKDAAGAVIDEVGASTGAPFAGANPSSPGTKASMERIDVSVAGTTRENWRTATTSRGLDTGAKMLATPGFENGSAEPVSSPSSSSSNRSSSDSSVSSVSSLSSSLCDLVPTITLQSGNWTGLGKVTLNVQATAAEGTMRGATCRFDFGDGFRSDSCNPGVHTYDHPGSFLLSLTVKNQCGNTLIQSRTVEVMPLPAGSGIQSAISVSPQPFDGSHLVISGVLPNPDSKDRDREWIEIKNLEDRAVPLAGWHLAIGLKTARRFVIDAVSQIPPHETVRLYQLESGIELSNAAGRVQLVSPVGTVVSSVIWDRAEEGRVYKSDAFRAKGLKGIVRRMMGSLNFEVQLEGPSALLAGEDSVNVRLVGIQAMDAWNDLRYIQYQQKAFDFSRALIENKKVELLFDSKVWHDDGSLQAYVVLDDGRILQKELLLAGLVSADTNSLYNARQEYLDAQQKAILAKAGFWSLGMIPYRSIIDGALKENKKIDLTVEKSYSEVTTNSGRILITEVFSSPIVARNRPLAEEAESGSFIGSEWLEFFNPDTESLSLRGWKLSIGKKTITFGKSSIVPGRRHVIVLAHQLGLKLRNNGDSIELKSPSKTYVVSLSYPRIKNGQSYTFDETTESYCMSKSPSPGESDSCRGSAVQLGAKTEETIAKRKTKNTKQRRSVYDKYALDYKRTMSDAGAEAIALTEPVSKPTPSFVLVLIGTLMGAMCSLLVLSSRKVREVIFGG